MPASLGRETHRRALPVDRDRNDQVEGLQDAVERLLVAQADGDESPVGAQAVVERDFDAVKAAQALAQLHDRHVDELDAPFDPGQVLRRVDVRDGRGLGETVVGERLARAEQGLPRGAVKPTAPSSSVVVMSESSG